MDDDKLQKFAESDVTDYDVETAEPKPRLRSLMTRGTRARLETIRDKDTGEWRDVVKIARRQMDDEAKQIFIDHYQQWGRLGESAAEAGVTPTMVKRQAQDDEEFGEAMLLCEEAYRDKLIGHHQDLLFNGTLKESYDRQGNLVSRERVYPIRLIELELKKHDAGYRDKQEIDLTVKGGVLVAPPEMKSVDDWESRYSQAKDITPEGDEEDDS